MVEPCVSTGARIPSARGPLWTKARPSSPTTSSGYRHQGAAPPPPSHTDTKILPPPEFLIISSSLPHACRTVDQGIRPGTRM